MEFSARLEHDRLDPERELRELVNAAAGAGAIVSFVGIVRPSGEGGAVGALVLEVHPILTQRSLDAIATQASRRFQVERVHVVHRGGTLAPGEPIVFAAAAAAHRRAAFEAADYLMDRLKTEAVFWKREDGPGGSRWIEPTDADYAAFGRWDR